MVICIGMDHRVPVLPSWVHPRMENRGNPTFQGSNRPHSSITTMLILMAYQMGGFRILLFIPKIVNVSKNITYAAERGIERKKTWEKLRAVSLICNL
jgi:ABC-type sugar transport system permease subunit